MVLSGNQHKFTVYNPQKNIAMLKSNHRNGSLGHSHCFFISLHCFFRTLHCLQKNALKMQK